MPDIGTYVWLIVALGAFVVGFFVGKKHGIRVEKAASTIRESAKSTVGKL